jgi:NAD(P)-dependent dehydrogenase (short-subunit alcohol dehydrogenase family)
MTARIADQKRILVTGRAGFLGSYLCDRLLAQGRKVLCADNFCSGTRDNVVHLLSNPRIPVRCCPDITVVRRDLGWELGISLVDARVRTFARFEQQLNDA